jgi:hypothetical protein
LPTKVDTRTAYDIIEKEKRIGNTKSKNREGAEAYAAMHFLGGTKTKESCEPSSEKQDGKTVYSRRAKTILVTNIQNQQALSDDDMII